VGSWKVGSAKEKSKNMSKLSKRPQLGKRHEDHTSSHSRLIASRASLSGP